MADGQEQEIESKPSLIEDLCARFEEARRTGFESVRSITSITCDLNITEGREVILKKVESVWRDFFQTGQVDSAGNRLYFEARRLLQPVRRKPPRQFVLSQPQPTEVWHSQR